MVGSNTENVLTYRRGLHGETSYVAVNFTATDQPVEFPTEVHQVLSTSAERTEPFSSVSLEPNEAIVVR